MSDSLTWMVTRAWWAREGIVAEESREARTKRSAIRSARWVSNHETQTQQQVGRPAGANLVEGDGAASAQCHDREGGGAIAAAEALVAA